MGFFIAEEIEFPEYGLNVAGCYVTIKAAFTCSKIIGGIMMMQGYDPNMKYIAHTRYFIYSDKDKANYLAEKSIVYTSETPINDPIAKLYAEIKAQFPDKTLLDD